MKKLISKIKDIFFMVYAVFACLILAVALGLTDDEIVEDYDPWDCYQ